jgi:hypothetical protein
MQTDICVYKIEKLMSNGEIYVSALSANLKTWPITLILLVGRVCKQTADLANV